MVVLNPTIAQYALVIAVVAFCSMQITTKDGSTARWWKYSPANPENSPGRARMWYIWLLAQLFIMVSFSTVPLQPYNFTGGGSWTRMPVGLVFMFGITVLTMKAWPLFMLMVDRPVPKDKEELAEAKRDERTYYFVDNKNFGWLTGYGAFLILEWFATWVMLIVVNNNSSAYITATVFWSLIVVWIAFGIWYTYDATSKTKAVSASRQ